MINQFWISALCLTRRWRMKFFINNKKIQRDRVGKNFDSRGKQPKSLVKTHKTTAVLCSWLEETSNCTVKLVRFSPSWNWNDGKLPKSCHLFDFASSKYTSNNLFFCSFSLLSNCPLRMGLSKTLLLFCYSIKRKKKRKEWKPEFPANEPVLVTYIYLWSIHALLFTSSLLC